MVDGKYPRPGYRGQPARLDVTTLGLAAHV